jgi:hypothetical protein
MSHINTDFFVNSHSGGWSPNWVHSARRPLNSLLYLPGWLWWWRIWWNEDWQGKPNYLGKKTCPSATSSTTNPTWPDPGLNPGRRGGKPASNRLSYGAAMSHIHIDWVLKVSVTIFVSIMMQTVSNTLVDNFLFTGLIVEETLLRTKTVKLTANQVTSDVKSSGVRADGTCFITRSGTVKLGRMLIVCLGCSARMFIVQHTRMLSRHPCPLSIQDHLHIPLNTTSSVQINKNINKI